MSELTTDRVEEWRFDLLDLDDQVVGEIELLDHSFDYNVHAPIRLSGIGEVQWDGRDWSQYRVQPWYTANGTPWPLGVLIPATPEVAHTRYGGTVRLEMYDKLLVLLQDKIDQTFTVDAGADPVAAAVAVIQGAGETSIQYTPYTGSGLRNPLVWVVEDEVTKLQVVNDLLAAANYFSVWCDGYGRYRLEPYVRPQERGLVHTFSRGPSAVHLPEFVRLHDLFWVPNKVVLISLWDLETAPARGVATDTRDDSPFSYSARNNRWVVYTETNVAVSESVDDALMDELAERRLTELQQVAATDVFEHLPLPLQLNDAVGLDEPGKVSGRAVVEEISYRAGALCQSTVREVL